MLTTLHVKNLAIIDEVEVNFTDNLNILTGETGAGKSIIIGSINIALGEKTNKDIIRNGADYALVDLVFTIDNKSTVEYLESKDISVDNDEIIISRKIMQNKSVCKINGEIVPIATLKEISKFLLDIHGQNEHQSLLYKNNHLKILDKYAGVKIKQLKQDIKDNYTLYVKTKKELTDAKADSGDKTREISLLEYQRDEIDEVGYTDGEEEKLEERYKELNSVEKIIYALSHAYNILEENDESNISTLMSQVSRSLRGMESINKRLEGICDQANTLDSLVKDLTADIVDYKDEVESNPEELSEITKRLDLIRNIQVKYGNTYSDIMNFYDEVCAKLERYENLDEFIQKKEKELENLDAILTKKSEELTKIRTELSKSLEKDITKALKDLNFLDVKFVIEMRKLEHFTDNGWDEIEFMISTNPGEPIRPLAKVASGGELSRIMLGIKSILADNDEIHTLIFDEIDTGISGRTAQKVSEKLVAIAKSHQVICITHLPQIAAMADSNFVIVKETDNVKTNTNIKQITGDEVVDEISRMLGGVEITESVKQNATEMINLANRNKLK